MEGVIVLTIKPKRQIAESGEESTAPDGEIPAGHRVRFHAGLYEAIGPDESWPEDVAPEDPPAA